MVLSVWVHDIDNMRWLMLLLLLLLILWFAELEGGMQVILASMEYSTRSTTGELVLVV
jgi:hypothetical protein